MTATDFRTRVMPKLQTDPHGRLLARCSTMPDKKPSRGHESDSEPSVYVPVHGDEAPNLVTSMMESGRHRPVLDLDFACRLVPSQTPGNFHLYMDGVTVSDEDWRDVLDAMAEAGILQKRWVENMDTNGAVALRYTPPVAVTPSVLQHRHWEDTGY